MTQRARKRDKRHTERRPERLALGRVRSHWSSSRVRRHRYSHLLFTHVCALVRLLDTIELRLDAHHHRRLRAHLRSGAEATILR